MPKKKGKAKKRNLKARIERGRKTRQTIRKQKKCPDCAHWQRLSMPAGIFNRGHCSIRRSTVATDDAEYCRAYNKGKRS